MRVLLWNVNGGQPAALDWLDQQAWDVAMLLEVKRPCLRLLRERSWGREDTSDEAKRSGHQLAVAILHRPGIELVGRVPPPDFRAMGGRYRHRVLVVELRDESGVTWTVLAAHMPNSRFPSGKDHRPKDNCFQELRYWMATRPAEERLVIGMDANRSDWQLSESKIKRTSIEVQTFLRRPDLLGLQDAAVAAHPDRRERPETYWQPRTGKGEYFDRVLVSRGVEVRSCDVALDRSAVGKLSGALSDHAPVVADLASVHPG